MFSSRIDRGNRLTWERDGDVIVLRNHCNHDDVYRWLHTRTCDERVQAQLDAARPFVTWLNERVGPSTRPRPR